MIVTIKSIYDLLVQLVVIFALSVSVGYLSTLVRKMHTTSGHYVILINNILKLVMDNQVITFFEMLKNVRGRRKKRKQKGQV